MPAAAPFFIVGAPRSGTTLLRLLLNAHARICIPPESHFIVDLYKALGERWTVESVCQALVQHERFREWQLDIDVIRRAWRVPPPTWAALWDAVYRSYAERHDKQRWADKTPDYVLHLDLLSALFAEAKFIHLIRDGRDVACSLLEVPWFTGTIADCAQRWCRMVDKGREQGRCLGGERYLEIRYESLVSEPQSTLQRICGFVDEAFQPQMLNFYLSSLQHIPHHRRSWHSNVTQPVSNGYIKRWRRDWGSAQQREFEEYCGELLRDLGYETVSV